ncbi:hypothetical protein [Chitinimonas taiwanensis]|uniref:hypothetical protein n=1 Tax=Chitinimonas taiwanensis TaxID=240412 RepID=UPI0011149196|nr:hypothetical protein [Chitinimonas taiwanensis]
MNFPLASKASLLLTLLFFYSSHSYAACPKKFSGELLIAGWDEEEPKEITLERHKENSDLKKPEEVLSSNFQAKKSTNEAGRSFLNISFKDHIFLPLGFDYRLRLNNKVEFLITEITPTGVGAWGCPLESFKVNNCPTTFDRAITLDSACGKKIEN